MAKYPKQEQKSTTMNSSETQHPHNGGFHYALEPIYLQYQGDIRKKVKEDDEAGMFSICGNACHHHTSSL
jgi:hypothetical protein